MKRATSSSGAVKSSIVAAVLLLLAGKLYVSDESGLSFLWAYGGLVTLVLWFTFVITYLKYRDPAESPIDYDASDDPFPLYVSCMVAVRNEEGHIGTCLESIIGQSYKFKEIIVVNDASTDGTQAVLEQFVVSGQIRVINLPINLGKKAALTEAMKIARGQLFAHTDSDSVWAPDAIERIVRIFEANPKVGAVSGHGRASNSAINVLTRVQDSWMEGQFSIRKAFESVFGAVTCVSGPLAVFRREAIYNLLPAWSGDSFLGQEFRFATDRTLTGFVLADIGTRRRIRAKFRHADFPFATKLAEEENWQVIYSKSARSWTLVPDTIGKFLKQQIRWKKSFIRNTFFTGKFFWRKPFPVAAVYYAHILFVVVGPFVAFRHLIYLPLSGNPLAPVLYLAGIGFVGLMFGLACKLESQDSSHWIYRPLMSYLSTLVLSWLLFYSAATIRKMTWHRG